MYRQKAIFDLDLKSKFLVEQVFNFSQTKVELEGVKNRLLAHQKTLDTSVEQMNSSLGHLAGDVGESLSVLSGRLDTLGADVERISASLDQLAGMEAISFLPVLHK